MTDIPIEQRIEDVDIEEEVKRSYLDYAMSVIVGRALPDARDGLKPVHRRILHTMNEENVRPGTPFKKSARVVGSCMGKYHPHGDQAIYDSLVRMAQDWAMRTPLVQGHGNFGSPDGDPAAAMRYCVSGETLVATVDGPVRVDEIAADAPPNSDTEIDLKVFGRRGEPVRATTLFHSGDHPTLRLTTSDGSSLVGTQNHPVLVLADVAGSPLLLWKLLEELRPGDRVARIRGLYAFAELSDTHDMSDTHDIVAEIAESLSEGAAFVRVSSVVGAGVRPVYSLRIDSDDHAFITNGFVSHNTECRLSPVAMELLRDIGEETVDFIPNYDGEETEPVVLPARFPNLLVNGSTGIAVGMATNIPPHNMTEIIDATVAMIDKPDIAVADLLKIVKGPDFPTGGIIMGRQGIKDAFMTGRGSVKVRGKATVEESKSGRQRIIITELPYMVSGDRVLAKIAEMVEKKVVTGIATTRDSLKNESNRHGLRLVVELKRDAIPQVVLNNLYKHTQLQDNFGVNMLALVDGVPRTLSLQQVLQTYIGHQVEVIERRTTYRLRRAEERSHILEGLLVAINNLDAVIKLIRGSADADAARTGLMERFELTEIQANAILDMQLRRLAALERQKIIDEHAELQKAIANLKDILANPHRVRQIIKEEMTEIRDKFGNDRRTAIQADEGDMDIEDLIADEDVVITLTRSGYIKRVNLNVYRTQGRGGKGVRGAKPKEGDIVEILLTTNAHAYVLFFSNRGKVYRIKAHEIPEKDRTARGTSIRNLLPLSGEDSIAAVIDTRDYETHKYLVIATAKGIIKKTEFRAYDSSRRDGIIAVKLRPGDEVVQVRATSGEDELILATRKGQSIVFPETEVRPMGRDASGVQGIRVKPDDVVMVFSVVDPNGELLVVTDAGYGKRTLLTQYPRQHRGGSGVRTVHLTERKGFVAGAMMIRPGHEVFLISSAGQVIRIPCKDVRRTGRDAQGVRVMRLQPGEKVAAMAPVIADEEGVTAAPPA